MHSPYASDPHSNDAFAIHQDTQDRIRKRIREDLKEAIGAHSDYAENVFPKLKRAYMKKSQDVEVPSSGFVF